MTTLDIIDYGWSNFISSHSQILEIRGRKVYTSRKYFSWIPIYRLAWLGRGWYDVCCTVECTVVYSRVQWVVVRILQSGAGLQPSHVVTQHETEQLHLPGPRPGPPPHPPLRQPGGLRRHQREM